MSSALPCLLTLAYAYPVTAEAIYLGARAVNRREWRAMMRLGRALRRNGQRPTDTAVLALGWLPVTPGQVTLCRRTPASMAAARERLGLPGIVKNSPVTPCAMRQDG